MAAWFSHLPIAFTPMDAVLYLTSNSDRGFIQRFFAAENSVVNVRLQLFRITLLLY